MSSSKPETPKRLAPTRDTMRELYLKSGNRCAFPACRKALFKNNGVFVGQICHIEAAEPGGERFNVDQTNEQRRAPSNLLLMCYDHHIETNNVSKFPVVRMREIKSNHEKYFSDVVGTMLKSITDHTTLSEPVFSVNLNKIKRILEWDYSSDEFSDMLIELNSLVNKLATIPIPSRELFNIIVRRGKTTRFGDTLQVSVPEIQQATGLEIKELRETFSILDNYGFTCDNDLDDMGIQLIGVSSLKSGWPIWTELKIFCKKEMVDISQLIINLDFSILDEP